MFNRIPASSRYTGSLPPDLERGETSSSISRGPQAQAASVEAEPSQHNHQPLPSGWEQSHDAQTQEMYFIHSQSQHVQEERPYPLLPGWKEVIRKDQNSDSQLYYFNNATREELSADFRPEYPQQFAHLARTEIEPNHTTFPAFLFKDQSSWGCERRAAAIEGSTIDFKDNQDIEAVCIRLLQTDKSALTYKAAASIEAFFSLAHLALYASGRGSMLNVVNSAAGAASTIPHVGVSKQYSAVNQQCRDFLTERFDSDFVRQLEKQNLNKKGIDNIINLLSSRDPTIETLKLETLLQNEVSGSAQNSLSKLFSRLWQNLYPEVKLQSA